MSAKDFNYLASFNVFSVTAEVTPGSEPALGLAVDLDGAVSVNARGVVTNSRAGYVTITSLGQTPAKVEDGVTLAKGAPVAASAAGELIAATATSDILGVALEPITSASGDYIEILVSPKPYVA